jgi:hypothetical protein
MLIVSISLQLVQYESALPERRESNGAVTTKRSRVTTSQVTKEDKSHKSQVFVWTRDWCGVAPKPDRHASEALTTVSA